MKPSKKISGKLSCNPDDDADLVNWHVDKDWMKKKQDMEKALMEKYRPKEIRCYEENGHVVHVYEARDAVNFDYSSEYALI